MANREDAYYVVCGDPHSDGHAEDAQTLEQARAVARQYAGGRLYGQFGVDDIDDEPGYAACEGWNLGEREGCDVAVIYRRLPTDHRPTRPTDFADVPA